MSAESYIGPPPLDLRAVEARLEHAPYRDVRPAGWNRTEAGVLAFQLLAHCRALRAALRGFTGLHADELTPEIFQVGRDVLAQATDQGGT